MALEATHIRLAMDIKDKYVVKDLGKYISGTIYPDSRYITGIDRNLTHNEDILDPDFAKNDFRKGWQVHQLCDIIQHQTFRENIPLLNRHPNESWEEDKWVEFTAAKIIQDMLDAVAFDLESCLGYLEFADNPNGEDIREVRRYNQIMVDLYKGRERVSVDQYIGMWLELGIDDGLGEKIRAKLEEFLKKDDLVGEIGKCYQKLYEKTYQQII